ncbi:MULTISPECIES: Arm DNA-binding domain-containing protein [unclassified Bartonella]|uniref:Arm DNA-binding domain-containing protein n=1 Tax=unclassified Bartonella TaxID=2645622 RepID=UPI0009C25709|nr:MULTISPECIES: Arm DNA-binding domain-containing protein [unclassified Bartonella]AQX18160.1 protein of unknown function (DUF4102) [Bartonella sp. A1379B]AQX22675.1 protein of unknown function (DUF4102) [Bartonella sp. 11B]AQX24041.1 protein of unknown function (DUF4102) [Bartonella sp. 114]AQX25124.1 protein of unknown function (DUF4102) [Bartonella sp. Coyote22sub2]
MLTELVYGLSKLNQIKDDGFLGLISIKDDKRRREMGLGSCRNVSLKEARLKASACRDLLNQGIDPIRQKQKEYLRRAGGGISLREIASSAFEAKKKRIEK